MFRDFLKLLVDSGKKFLVLGNQNDIACKEVTQMLIDKKFWFGHKRGKMIFDTLSGPKAFGNIRWFTNLEVSGIDFLNLTCKYSPEAYKKYDNYDAINVDRVDEIPADYSGVMGVPISFLDKWNPEQFEILGVTGRDRFRTKIYPPHIQHSGSHDKELVSKLNTVGAFVIPDKLTDKVCYELDGKFYSGVYRRLLIRILKH